MNLPTTLTRWNPIQEFETLQNRMRTLFNQNGNGDFLLGGDGGAFSDWSPAVDVSEDDDEYVITADLPEVKKEDVKITTENNVLTIRGERTREEEEKNKTWHCVERSYGKYERSFRLPDEIDQKKIDASFRDGVLTIQLPKLAEKKHNRAEKTIAIK